MMVPPYPPQQQAIQINSTGGSGDLSQQINTGWAQMFQTNRFPSQQLGDQSYYNVQQQSQMMPYQHQHQQHIVLNLEFSLDNKPWPPAQHYNIQHPSQMMAYQQQQQHFVPNVGDSPGNVPWFMNPSVGSSVPVVGTMGQGGLGQMAFGFGNVNQQEILGLSSEQRTRQLLSPSVSQSEMRSTSTQQFNWGRWRPSFVGRRGGRHSLGHGGGHQQDG